MVEPGWGDRLWSRPAGEGTILQRAAASLSATLESESDRWFLWVPVCLGTGAALYFSALSEPSIIAVSAFLGVTIALYALLRRRRLAAALAGALLCIAIGYGDAKLRTAYVASPTLTRATGLVEVAGWVERAELRSAKRYRLTLRVISIAGLEPDQTPYRVRLTVSGAHELPVAGTAVRIRGRLRPIPEPVEPGAFDFARKAWFDRLGGLGYAIGPPTADTAAPRPPLDLRLRAVVDNLRQAVGRRIRQALPGDAGALATALITGDRGAIKESTLDALRHSGLAHVLAISGLHMAMIAGAFYWLIRASLAAFPVLALHYPIKKWAAGIALLGAAFYLALSGASVATQRAFIMISIMFIAIMLDRPALTLRNVAIAATLILLAFPESITNVSFQMSFAAVIALVAVYEETSRRAAHSFPKSVWGRAWSGGTRYLLAIGMTTLVAGIAIAPFAAFHFHKLAQYSLIANLAAMPIFGLIVMPMALTTLLVLPLGLEAWPLAVMAFGVETVVWVAEHVSSWKGAVIHVAAMPVSALVLLSIGGLWMCLWRRRWRVVGLMIAAFGLMAAANGTRPDILIDREGDLVAARGEGGALATPIPKRRSYSLEKWLLADGDRRTLADAHKSDLYDCDELACLAQIKGKTVAFIRHPAAIAEECRKADIVVSQIPVRGPCPKARVVIDRFDLWADGAHALYFDGRSLRVETVAEARGKRPWTSGRARKRRRQPAGQALAKPSAQPD